jgi:hypothetical protein
VELENQPLPRYSLRFYDIDSGEIPLMENIYDLELKTVYIVPQDRSIWWNHKRKYRLLENQTEEEILAAKQANALILSKVFLKI